MKSRIPPASLLASMLFTTALALTGCATSRTELAMRTTATLPGVKQDYVQADRQREAATDALSELSISPNEDLQQAYDVFSESAKRMQQTGRHLIEHADAMHFRGASYLVESEKSGTACVFPRQPAAGDKRAVELGVFFEAIAEKSWEVKRAYRAYQFDIAQIRDYLSCNVNPLGVESISPFIEKARVDSDSLKYALEQALTALERAKTAQAGTAPKED